MNDFLGIDLAVVPTFVAHDASTLDVQAVTKVVRLRNAPGSLRRNVETDLGVIADRENLAQALILRLLTPRGSLAVLGHAAYGSRLHELIGQNKTPALRNLCRALILEVVAQEPRVEDKAVELTFDPAAETSSSFVFTLAVQPRSDDAAPLGLTLEVAL